MADTSTSPIQDTPLYYRRRVKFAALAAALAPVSYLAGRYAMSTPLPEPWNLVAISTALVALGALLGIPIGLFYGSLKFQAGGSIVHHYHPSFMKQQDKILEQLKIELLQTKSLLEARRGDAITTTPLRYDTGFWMAVKASGQLFVMQEPELLATIARAYSWLDEANRLEALAFESQNVPFPNQGTTSHLIGQARLIDGVLTSAVELAVIAINAQLGLDSQTPPGAEPEPAIARTEIS